MPEKGVCRLKHGGCVCVCVCGGGGGGWGRELYMLHKAATVAGL